MTPTGQTRRSGATAALSGILPGVQGFGVWTGRRQLFVRFAGEAETATMYTADGMVQHLERALDRTKVHSIVITGRDPLSGVNFLAATFEKWKPTVPVMVNVDVPRPEVVAELVPGVSMIQVTADFSGPAASSDRALEVLAAAAQARCDHALVLEMRDGVTDAQLLRLIEQARGVSSGTKIVVHPVPGAERRGLDRRYTAILDQATAIHPDVQLVVPIPSPVGVR